jgi:hypothetical protein
MKYDPELDMTRYARNFNERVEANAPFPPVFLRTQSTGLQVGNYPYLVHDLFDYVAPEDTGLVQKRDVFHAQREWGMRMVHEIIRGGPHHHRIVPRHLERAVYGFGYGTDALDVFNYWTEPAALRTNHDQVKWILLTRPQDRRAILVLQSWQESAESVTVQFNPDVIGFPLGPHMRDGLTGRNHTVDEQHSVSIPLAGRFAMKLLYLDDAAFAGGNVLFADDFTDHIRPDWTSTHALKTVPPVERAPVQDRVLRIGRNTAPWLGASRLQKWDCPPQWMNASLTFRFRVGAVPENGGSALLIATRALQPEWSRHGLSHTRLQHAQWIKLGIESRTGHWQLTRQCRCPNGDLAEKTVVTEQPADTQWHTVQIILEDARTRVMMDNKTVIDVGDTPTDSAAFGFQAGFRQPEQFEYVDIDDVVLRKLDNKE